MNKVISISHKKFFISFYTLVTNIDDYEEMLNSAKISGFERNDISFNYFDNTTDNLYDGYSAINFAITNAESEYIIVCHQDILFEFDGYNVLIEKIEEINKINPNWAVLGNAGRNSKGEYFINITDPNGRQKIGVFPEEVMSLDENFLIINSRSNIGCSKSISGFHLYGTDLCQNANYLGYSCYVIDFHLYHKSSGKLNEDFFEARKKFIDISQDRLNSKIIYTACTKFYVSQYYFLNKLINIKIINKLYRLIKRLK